MISTLAIDKRIYEAEVAKFNGWGGGVYEAEETWTDDKLIKIQMDVASGLRRFYFCGFSWSFLTPEAELPIAAGSNTIQLPDGFGGIDGGTRAAVINSSGTRIRVLEFTGPARVLHAYTNSSSSGPPELLCQRPLKNIQPGKMQHSELFMFPIPDADYTLRFAYSFTPDYLLDVTQPFAYGGVEHHETILECCLAVAEARRDNMLGVHAAESQRLLERSMKIDRRKQAKNLGYNGDRSDERWPDRHWYDRDDHGLSQQVGVTRNGSFYN